MKRFLRYVLYRESYRLLRGAMRESPDSGGSDPIEPGKALEEGRAEPPTTVQLESAEQLKAALQRMDAYDFEHFVGDLWERMGWQTEVSTATADKGVDVIARKSSPYEQTLVIQAKRYGPNTTVGSPEVQQYASLRHQYDGVDKVLLVTTNRYTNQGKELAERLNVKCINGDELVQLILEHDALDLVAAYLDFVTIERTTATETTDDAEPEPATATTADATSTTQSTEAPTKRGSPPATPWQAVIAAATISWVVVFFSVLVLPESVWGLLFFTTWVALPVGIALDARRLADVTAWPRYTWAYVLASLLWFAAVIPGLVYLWRRRSVPLEGGPEMTGADGETSDDRDPDTTDKPNRGPTETAEANPTESTATTRGTSDDDATNDRTATRVIGYEDDQYTCQVERSPNGAWVVAIGRGTAVDDARVFVYDEGGLQWSERLEEPTLARIANTGRSAVIDGLDPDEHAAKVQVFDADGTPGLTHYLNADVADCAMTPDGATLAVTTHHPDDSVAIFDLETGERRANTALASEGVRDVTIEESDGTATIVLRPSATEEPVYGVDFDGNIVWEEGPGDQTDRMNGDDRGEPARIRETIETLRDAYEAAGTEPERNEIAHSLADAHWSLATADGVDDDTAQRHLERAKERYFELLPWYEGKAGAARVLREQGTLALEAGDETRAAACFQEIEQLETEYNVQLLTDEDERVLERLA